MIEPSDLVDGLLSVSDAASSDPPSPSPPTKPSLLPPSTHERTSSSSSASLREFAFDSVPAAVVAVPLRRVSDRRRQSSLDPAPAPGPLGLAITNGPNDPALLLPAPSLRSASSHTKASIASSVTRPPARFFGPESGLKSGFQASARRPPSRPAGELTITLEPEEEEEKSATSDHIASRNAVHIATLTSSPVDELVVSPRASALPVAPPPPPEDAPPPIHHNLRALSISKSAHVGQHIGCAHNPSVGSALTPRSAQQAALADSPTAAASPTLSAVSTPAVPLPPMPHVISPSIAFALASGSGGSRRSRSSMVDASSSESRARARVPPRATTTPSSEPIPPARLADFVTIAHPPHVATRVEANAAHQPRMTAEARLDDALVAALPTKPPLPWHAGATQHAIADAALRRTQLTRTDRSRSPNARAVPVPPVSHGSASDLASPVQLEQLLSAAAAAPVVTKTRHAQLRARNTAAGATSASPYAPTEPRAHLPPASSLRYSTDFSEEDAKYLALLNPPSYQPDAETNADSDETAADASVVVADDNASVPVDIPVAPSEAVTSIPEDGPPLAAESGAPATATTVPTAAAPGSGNLHRRWHSRSGLLKLPDGQLHAPLPPSPRGSAAMLSGVVAEEASGPVLVAVPSTSPAHRIGGASGVNAPMTIASRLSVMQALVDEGRASRPALKTPGAAAAAANRPPTESPARLEPWSVRAYHALERNPAPAPTQADVLTIDVDSAPTDADAEESKTAPTNLGAFGLSAQASHASLDAALREYAPHTLEVRASSVPRSAEGPRLSSTTPRPRLHAPLIAPSAEHLHGIELAATTDAAFLDSGGRRAIGANPNANRDAFATARHGHATPSAATATLLSSSLSNHALFYSVDGPAATYRRYATRIAEAAARPPQTREENQTLVPTNRRALRSDSQQTSDAARTHTEPQDAPRIPTPDSARIGSLREFGEGRSSTARLGGASAPSGPGTEPASESGRIYAWQRVLGLAPSSITSAASASVADRPAVVRSHRQTVISSLLSDPSLDISRDRSGPDEAGPIWTFFNEEERLDYVLRTRGSSLDAELRRRLSPPSGEERDSFSGFDSLAHFLAARATVQQGAHVPPTPVHAASAINALPPETAPGVLPSREATRAAERLSTSEAAMGRSSRGRSEHEANTARLRERAGLREQPSVALLDPHAGEAAAAPLIMSPRPESARSGDVTRVRSTRGTASALATTDAIRRDIIARAAASLARVNTGVARIERQQAEAARVGFARALGETPAISPPATAPYSGSQSARSAYRPRPLIDDPYTPALASSRLTATSAFVRGRVGASAPWARDVRPRLTGKRSAPPTEALTRSNTRTPRWQHDLTSTANVAASAAAIAAASDMHAEYLRQLSRHRNETVAAFDAAFLATIEQRHLEHLNERLDMDMQVKLLEQEELQHQIKMRKQDQERADAIAQRREHIMAT